MIGLKMIAAAALLLVLGACQSGGEIGSPASKQLAADAVLERIKGNTEVWTKGGGHYAEDGTLLAKWEGQPLEGTWRMDGDSLCLNVKQWGKEECQSYVDDNGVVKLVYKGKSSEQKLLPGNQLGSL